MFMLFVVLITTSSFAGELKCFGTEPFWNIKVLEDKIIVDDFSTDEPFESKIISRNNQDALQVIQAEGRTLNIRKALCNDGMSDNEYEFEVTVTDSSNQTETKYGCCIE